MIVKNFKHGLRRLKPANFLSTDHSSSIKIHELNYFIDRKGTGEALFQVAPLFSVHNILWNIFETAPLKLFSLPNAA